MSISLRFPESLGETREIEVIGTNRPNERLKTGIIDTVMKGGDTDTNAAICGSLLAVLLHCHKIGWTP
jgi:hypothetical protein